MNDPTLRIVLNGTAMSVPSGTRIDALLDDDHRHLGPFQPLGALVNNRPVGLSYALRANATVTTLDLSSREGMDIYRRTASAILYAAVLQISPDLKISVGQSIGMGSYFFEVLGVEADHKFLDTLRSHMRELIRNKTLITVERTTVEDATERLEKIGAFDQAKLTRQRRLHEVLLVHLDQYIGLLHGPIANNAGAIDRFALYAYEHGIVLDFPNERGELLEQFVPQPKLFNIYLETKKWNQLVRTETIGDLNNHCIHGTISDLVKVTEALHEKKIAAIADTIAADRDIRLILIAGPSSSGKTTFSKRLAIQLKVHGIEPVGISIDSYYRPHNEIPRHPDGICNFECIEAIDTPHLNDHLKKLLEGKAVELPAYSFHTGERLAHRAKHITLEKDQILIIEGIHGLNEVMSASVDHAHKFKIYVSALTQLCIDAHNRIFTTDSRLCRRIIRDRLFRGTSAAETIAMWPSVRAGEQKYIFPYQEDADVMFNSALMYEHALLKPLAERFLAEIPREHPSFMEASRLLRFFDYFIPIMPNEVPHNSLLREFIGGSSFKYG
ncbi:MAG: nucleoside kinase [Deltaproteobacteria bacterium]|nr:nucleoside kinase [Deltaproteobacteria bacterium]